MRKPKPAEMKLNKMSGTERTNTQIEICNIKLTEGSLQSDQLWLFAYITHHRLEAFCYLDFAVKHLRKTI